MEKCDHCDHPGFLVCFVVSKCNASVIENRSRRINFLHYLNDFLISKIEMKINFLIILETIVVIVINNIYIYIF